METDRPNNFFPSAPASSSSSDLPFGIYGVSAHTSSGGLEAPVAFFQTNPCRPHTSYAQLIAQVWVVCVYVCVSFVMRVLGTIVSQMLESGVLG